MKIKVKDGRLGIFVKNKQVIFSIINVVEPLSEEHLIMPKEKAISFLKKALNEITKERRVKRNEP